jgi:hypothetical protein
MKDLRFGKQLNLMSLVSICLKPKGFRKRRGYPLASPMKVKKLCLKMDTIPKDILSHGTGACATLCGKGNFQMWWRLEFLRWGCDLSETHRVARFLKIRCTFLAGWMEMSQWRNSPRNATFGGFENGRGDPSAQNWYSTENKEWLLAYSKKMVTKSL